MEKNLHFYWKLFASTFTISAFTFGGGFIIIPLLRKKFVTEYHWIEENEMWDLTAIAQSSPGAIAVNASILIGYRLAGFLGAFITILGSVLPPLILLSVISMGYAAFQNNFAVNCALRGMQAGVAAVIVDVTLEMGSGIIKEKKLLPVIMMFCAFIAAAFFKVNVIFLILICGTIGAAHTLYHIKKKKEGGTAL